MNILTIETSSEALCLGIAADHELLEDYEVIGRRHNQEVLPRIKSLLDKAELKPQDLQLIVYGRGPGSFTGVRIAVGVTQGLALGLQIPTVGISSLAILAQGVYRRRQQNQILTALHARETEVYWGAYQVNGDVVELVGKESVLDAHELKPLASDEGWCGVGSGWRHQPLIENALKLKVSEVELEAYPRAEDMVVLGKAMYQAGGAVAAEHAEPVYLREQVAQRPS